MSQNLHNSQASSGHSIDFDLHHPPYSKQLLGLGLPGQTDQRTNHHDYLKALSLCRTASAIVHTNKPHRHPAGVGISGGTGDSQYHPVLRKLINEKPQASDVGFGYLLSHSFIYLSPQIYGLKLPMPSKNTFNCVDSRKVSFLQHPYNTRF